MGEALIKGFISSGVSSTAKIRASVRSKERKLAMEALGIKAFGNALKGGAAALAAESDILFLGVCPTEPQPRFPKEPSSFSVLPVQGPVQVLGVQGTCWFVPRKVCVLIHPIHKNCPHGRCLILLEGVVRWARREHDGICGLAIA
jgi:hypothetical protein